MSVQLRENLSFFFFFFISDKKKHFFRKSNASLIAAFVGKLLCKNNFNSFMAKVPYHIETSPWTVFYLIGTFVMKELNSNLTHFKPMFHFYTIWKHETTRAFRSRFRNDIMVWNGLIFALLDNILSANLIKWSH